MASGTPVVASSIPANQKWVDAQLPVFLFEKDSSAELAKAITEVVNDQSILEKVGKSGPSVIKKKYSWEKESEKVLKKYFDLIESN